MSEKLRVAVVSNYPLNPEKVEGGVRSVTQNLVRGLQAYDDLEIHVIHCHSDVPSNGVIVDGKATVHYISRSKKRLIPNIVTSVGVVAGALKQLNPHVVNAHNGSFAVAGMVAGYPTIYTTHCVTRRYIWAVGGLYDHARLFMEAIFDHYAAWRATDIVAISPYVVDSYRWASQARFHRVDNPISEVFYSAANRAVPGRILFAGVIAEVKNLLLLLRSLERIQAQVPAAHVHVAGWVTSPRYRRAIERFLDRERMRERVKLLGFLDTPSLLREYEEASLLVLPSKEETQPIVIIEAMAAGKPVVATNVGGVADLVDDGETGFVVPNGDVAALAAGVARILLDPALGRKMGERGRQKASGRFSIERAAAGYRDVFLTVARSKIALAPAEKGEKPRPSATGVR